MVLQSLCKCLSCRTETDFSGDDSVNLLPEKRNQMWNISPLIALIIIDSFYLYICNKKNILVCYAIEKEEIMSHYAEEHGLVLAHICYRFIFENVVNNL